MTNTPQWYHFDASTKPVGRLATEIAHTLMGKDQVDYAPNAVANVYVVVTNTDKAVFTGQKESDKRYYRYSGYPGGMRARTVHEQRQRDSRKLIELAVFGMLPKNSLRQKMMLRLKLYKGTKHPHEPQLTTKTSNE